MANEFIPDDYESLIAALNREIAIYEARRDVRQEAIVALDTERRALGHHPNATAYRHGGIAASRDMGAMHVLPHIGFHLLPYADAIGRLRASVENEGCLIASLRTVCESDPMLEVSGLAWLADQGLLKRAAIDPFWLRRPKLALGQPAKLHGLALADADGHRGLYALQPDDLLRRFDALSTSVGETFGDLLAPVIAAGGEALAAIGAEANEAEAARRYWEQCESFAAHQDANPDRRWRWKPPLSRQGHHARTIAQARAIAMPAERTRGHAATWLDDHGANPRFRRD